MKKCEMQNAECEMKCVPRAQRRRTRSGVGLVEVLIALAIAASLLAAVASAVDASFKAYQINQEQATLMQRARLSMHRVLTQIRVCAEHGPHDDDLVDNFAAGQVITDSGIEMFDASDVLHVFRYDADADQLIFEVDGSSHVLLEGVDTFEVKLEPMRSPTSIKTGGSYDLLKRATITLTIRTTDTTSRESETTGVQTVTLSSSVMPRRNVW